MLSARLGAIYIAAFAGFTIASCLGGKAWQRYYEPFELLVCGKTYVHGADILEREESRV